MLKKYSILFGIIIAVALLVIATLYYPGDSQQNINSIGYSWQNNYLSNLFGAKAMNGRDNPSRPWAVCGMLFLAASFAVFFIKFSKKLPSKTSAGIIKYCGTGAMVFVFLAVTPYHDIMITIGGTLALISIFYITIFVFTSTLHWLIILCVVCMLVAYACNYIYYTRSNLEILPVVQKIALSVTIILMLCLHYFTAAGNFMQKKNKVLQAQEDAPTT
jgi:hypothetical protein